MTKNQIYSYYNGELSELISETKLAKLLKRKVSTLKSQRITYKRYEGLWFKVEKGNIFYFKEPALKHIPSDRRKKKQTVDSTTV